MEKVLLDTDIGSDIDDAVCLAYLLAQPECDLLGITTVTGEPVKRAMLASALCKVAGRDVPIYPGAESPLLIPQRQEIAHQAVALDNWDHDVDFPTGEAVDFLRRTIRANPGEVVLLTIGPLTNIGLLFREDPEAPSLLKALVMMCGSFTNQLSGYGASHLEWNAKGDAHATAIVYRTPVKIHRSVGIDVTLQVRMSAEEVRQRFRSDLLQPVLDFAEVWFERQDRIVFHDPLAASTIFDDGICTFERGTVDVELQSERLLGFMHWDPDGPESDHEVALSVDSERFFDHFFSAFK
ncbi:MAG: nucleoside hydrolase [Anaerolineales bacterium]|nr:nucleoside hydrolase [Anaerolineales bacterium]